MDKRTAIQLVGQVATEMGDSSSAHFEQDMTYGAFIREVAEGKYDTIKEVEEIAKILIKIEDLDFPRWYG